MMKFTISDRFCNPMSLLADLGIPLVLLIHTAKVMQVLCYMNTSVFDSVFAIICLIHLAKVCEVTGMVRAVNIL